MLCVIVSARSAAAFLVFLSRAAGAKIVSSDICRCLFNDRDLFDLLLSVSALKAFGYRICKLYTLYLGGFEYVYATDIKNGVSDSVQYIIIGSGNDEKLVYLTEKVPRISGIGVVCSGGGDISIQNELISLLSAAFDVPSNKIYVTGGG